MCCSRTVLPVRGGATIKARCPLPRGVNRSITRVVMGMGPVFEAEPVLGGDRRELIKGLDVAILFGLHAVDIGNLLEAWPLLLSPGLDHSGKGNPFAQSEFVDHASGNERIGQLADVIGFGITKEAVTVGVHFKNATTGPWPSPPPSPPVSRCPIGCSRLEERERCR